MGLFSLVTSIGEKWCNLLGEELIQIEDDFSILNDGEPTFLAANRSSVIDLLLWASVR